MSYDVLRACHVCDTFIVKGTPKSIFMVSYGIFHYKPSITIHFNGTRVPPWKPPHVWPSHDRFKTSVGQPTQSMLDRRAAASDTNSDTNSSDLSALSDTRHAGTTSALAPSMAAFYGGFVRWSDMKWYESYEAYNKHMMKREEVWCARFGQFHAKLLASWNQCSRCSGSDPILPCTKSTTFLTWWPHDMN